MLKQSQRLVCTYWHITLCWKVNDSSWTRLFQMNVVVVFCVLCWTINYWRKWISDFHLWWHCIFIYLLHRVGPGGKACSSTCHPVSVVIWLWELESVIRPTWIVSVYSTRVSSPSIPSSSAPPGPHPASTASPSTSDCPAAQQRQCRHGKNQRR